MDQKCTFYVILPWCGLVSLKCPMAHIWEFLPPDHAMLPEPQFSFWNVPERQTLALICHFRALLRLKTTRNALFTWHDFQYGDVSSWKADMGKIMKIPARNSYFSIKFCCKTRLECKYGHKITNYGLCFAINRLEMHFLRGFMEILAPGRPIWVELWGFKPKCCLSATYIAPIPSFNAKFSMWLSQVGITLL